MTYSGSTTGGPKGYPNFNINYKEQFVDFGNCSETFL
jgi:hypothetical protein